LYSLCLLSSVKDDDKCAKEAKVVLWDMFVRNLYPISTNTTLWLCEVINNMLHQDALTDDGVACLLELIVVMLLREFAGAVTAAGNEPKSFRDLFILQVSQGKLTVPHLRCFSGLAGAFFDLFWHYCNAETVPQYRRYILDSFKTLFRKQGWGFDDSGATRGPTESPPKSSQYVTQLHVVPVFARIADSLTQAALCCFSYMLQSVFDRPVCSSESADVCPRACISQILAANNLTLSDMKSTASSLSFSRFFQASSAGLDPSVVGLWARQSLLELLIHFFYSKRAAQSDVETSAKDAVSELFCLCHMINSLGEKVTIAGFLLPPTMSFDVVHILQKFADLLSIYLEDITESRSLQGFENVLLALQSLCENACATATHESTDIAILRDISWRIYDMLCTEERSVWFIAMLEKDVRKSSSALFLFQSVWERLIPDGVEIGDVDAVVRSIRFVLLRQLGVVEGKEHHQIVADKSYFLQQINKLDVLTSDLSMGMDGNSGGISADMFNELLLLIMSVYRSIQSMMTAVSFDDNAAVILSNALSRLRHVTESVEIRVVAHARTLFSLLFHEARSIYTVASLQCNHLPRTNDDSHSAESLLHEHDVFCRQIVAQCVAALEREVSRVNELNDFAMQGDAADELSESSFDRDSDNDDSTRQGRNPAVDGVASQGPVKMNDKKLSTWGLSSLCQTFENVWARSHEHNIFSMDDCDVDGEAIRRSYNRMRTLDLMFVLESFESMLQAKHSGQHAGEQVDEGGATACAIQKASASVRQKMCSLLECIFKALDTAAESVLACLQDNKADTSKSLSFALQCGDDLCYLMAWVSLRQRNSHLTSCLQGWYAQEVTSLQEDRNQSVYQPATSLPSSRIVSKLQGVFRTVQSVEATIQKLSQQVKKHKKQNATAMDTSLSDLYPEEDNAHASYRSSTNVSRDGAMNGDGNHTLPTYSSLKALVKDCLSLLQELRTGQDPASETARTKRKQSNQVQRRARRVRRQGWVRSRNPVIDSWLERDRQSGHKGNFSSGNTESRDYDEDDAFVDLEDFLVDG
jgi:hypothetical protein